ncbi:hypothetical protein [Bacillus thuringiensis]
MESLLTSDKLSQMIKLGFEIGVYVTLAPAFVGYFIYKFTKIIQGGK